MIEFLNAILSFINSILQINIIAGISLFSLLFYCVLLIWTATTMMKR